MLNRNFKTIMLGWLMGSKNRNYDAPLFAPQTIYNVGGGGGTYPPPADELKLLSAAIVNALNAVTTNNRIARQSVNRLFIAVGTGTTEATEEDYTLETENTDITCEAITQTYTQAYKRQITATFNNPTSQDITLKEAGLFYETYMNNEYYINTIMLARENINVTIPAGETKAITMEIG
jgi:hypothetical protein